MATTAFAASLNDNIATVVLGVLPPVYSFKKLKGTNTQKARGE
jgi:hypothetical protein